MFFRKNKIGPYIIPKRPILSKTFNGFTQTKNYYLFMSFRLVAVDN